MTTESLQAELLNYLKGNSNPDAYNPTILFWLEDGQLCTYRPSIYGAMNHDFEVKKEKTIAERFRMATWTASFNTEDVHESVIEGMFGEGFEWDDVPETFTPEQNAQYDAIKEEYLSMWMDGQEYPETFCRICQDAIAPRIGGDCCPSCQEAITPGDMHP